jgi:hypothetical protein
MPSKRLLVIGLRGDVCFSSSAGKGENGAVCRTICSAVRSSSSLPEAFTSRSAARRPWLSIAILTTVSPVSCPG